MSECALEGGREKKSALSPETHSAQRVEGVQERRIGWYKNFCPSCFISQRWKLFVE